MAAGAIRPEDVDWVQLKKDIEEIVVETKFQRLLRRCKENPVIPLGCVGTVSALCYGLYSTYHGRSMMSQYMMRTRIVAQGVTIVAVVLSLGATLPTQD